MRSKAQLIKVASTLKDFSQKIKTAQEGEVLTPEAVQDIAIEIQQVAEVASELAEEIAENVPVEEVNVMDERREERTEEEVTNGPPQIETAQDDEEEDEKKKLTEQVAGMKNELNQIKRAGMLEKLASKYASLFPKSLREAKMNEILTSKQGMDIIQAKVQEASDIITSKTMIKVASMTNSIFDIESDNGEEVNIAMKV